ncbi:DUF2644 domain-containing protein [Candidatus Woesebacteria bacterium]|nr:DUF2644 domain-containing protein [Candidatus Woesebacteria bacterium]
MKTCTAFVQFWSTCIVAAALYHSVWFFSIIHSS